MEALKRMLEEYNPFWYTEFPSIEQAAEFYGLTAMLEYHDLSDDEYRELNFHEA